MEHSRISYVLLTHLCLCVLSMRDITWKICSFKRPCEARLEVDDYSLHSGCVTNDQRDKLTITLETQNPFLMLQNFDVWTTLCRTIEKFYTCFVVSLCTESVSKNDFVEMERPKIDEKSPQKMLAKKCWPRS